MGLAALLVAIAALGLFASGGSSSGPPGPHPGPGPLPPGPPLPPIPNVVPIPPQPGPPPPVNAPTGLPQVQVTTHDTGPTGALNVRTLPLRSSASKGSLPHGAIVDVLQPLNPDMSIGAPIAPSAADAAAGVTGWYQISDNSSGMIGFAAAEFLTPVAAVTTAHPVTGHPQVSFVRLA